MAAVVNANIAHQSKEAHNCESSFSFHIYQLMTKRGKLMKIEIRKIIFHPLSIPHTVWQISIRFIPEYTIFFVSHNARKICCEMLINVADLNLTEFEFPFLFIYF